jgi:hypothetical protein
MSRLIGTALLAGLAGLCLSGCTTTRLEHRLAPPAEGDPFLGIGVTDAEGAFAATDADYGRKVGRSTSHGVLGLVAFGHAGAASAAKDGKVTRIETADVEVLQVKALWIPLYTRYTVVVRGE